MRSPVALGLAVIALAATQAAAQESVWLELDRPGENERIRLVAPLVEVRGRSLRVVDSDGRERGVRAPGDALPEPSGGAELVSADVVLAIDMSNTSLHAMGLDVDGDGKVGKNRRRRYPGTAARPHRMWTSDPGDTIIRAEIVAARAVIERLAQRGARLGVLTYTGQPRERSEVGPPETAHAGLDAIRITVDWSGTDISRALELAAEMLEWAPRKRGPSRPKVVLLFSDGKPTAPQNIWLAERRALKAARKLAEADVRIYTLAFGKQAREKPGVLRELAELTGGRYIPVLDPANVLRNLASVEFAKPGGLTMTNLTTGTTGRAIRVFSNGTFDGYLDLIEGQNLLEVAANGPGGTRVSELRTVVYEKPETETYEERRSAARMLVELRHRSAETELASLADGAPPSEPGVEGTVEVRPDRGTAAEAASRGTAAEAASREATDVAAEGSAPERDSKEITAQSPRD